MTKRKQFSDWSLKSGAYVQRGKNWDCIDGVAVVIR